MSSLVRISRVGSSSSKVQLFAPGILQQKQHQQQQLKLPQHQSVRHRGKYNYKMPHPRHDTARYLEEITRPVLVRQVPDPIDTCVAQKAHIAKTLKFSTREAVDFERFLAGHALELIDKHEIMLILHKHDCAGETLRQAKIEFKKNKTTMWNFNTTIMKLLIEQNPKYENLYPIVSTGLGKNFYFFCNEENLAKNMKLLKKMPFFALLGGMVHQDRLLTRDGLKEYEKLGDLDLVRSQVVATLGHQQNMLSRNLTSSMSSLSQALDQHSKSSEAQNNDESEK